MSRVFSRVQEPVRDSLLFLGLSRGGLRRRGRGKETNPTTPAAPAPSNRRCLRAGAEDGRLLVGVPDRQLRLVRSLVDPHLRDPLLI
eukprot:scaffold3949_cov229-Pinguiococcus_pyrenoidosus.AAC.3